MNQNQIRESINNRIIEALKKDMSPWRKPWRDNANCGFPANISSKNNYRGINPLLLQLTSLERNFTSRWWGTFAQWKKLGGSVKRRPPDVKKGEWGTTIVLWKPITKEEEDGEKKKTFFVMRTWNVFNLDQVEGDSLNEYRPNKEESFDIGRYEEVEQAINATKAKVNWGHDRASYVPPPIDQIYMPPRNSFESLRHLYATEFHELVHWGADKLNWSGSYAMGELIAEIGSCYLESALQIPHCEDMTNHHKYLKSWLEELQNDPKKIFEASRHASEIADYVLSFSNSQAMGDAA